MRKWENFPSFFCYNYSLENSKNSKKIIIPILFTQLIYLKHYYFKQEKKNFFFTCHVNRKSLLIERIFIIIIILFNKKISLNPVWFGFKRFVSFLFVSFLSY